MCLYVRVCVCVCVCMCVCVCAHVRPRVGMLATKRPGKERIGTQKKSPTDRHVHQELDVPATTRRELILKRQFLTMALLKIFKTSIDTLQKLETQVGMPKEPCKEPYHTQMRPTYACQKSPVKSRITLKRELLT